MTEKIRRPKETLCLLVWNEPLNVKEICKKMYGKRNSRVPGWITELRKDGWIKKIEMLDKDQREDYYIANPFAFRYYLLKWFKFLKIVITKEEHVILRDTLKSPAFKKYVGIIIDECLGNNYLPDNFYIKDRFSYDCAFYGFIGRYGNSKNDIDLSKLNFENIETFKLMDVKEISDCFCFLGDDLLNKIASLNPGMFMLLNSYFETLVNYVKK